MLTLSFIHNVAPKKTKPKTMDRKRDNSIHRKITLFISFQDPIFKQRSNPHRKPCVHKFGTKKLYTGVIMSVSTSLWIIPSQIYEQTLYHCKPKCTAAVHVVNRIFFTNQMLPDLSNCSSKTVLAF